SLEFHPNLTVVHGLSSTGREQVVRAIEALPAGQDSNMSGLLEAHGILFDLSAETLDILGLDAPVDLVVRASDLPVADDDAPMASVTPLFGEAAAPADPGGPDPAERAAVA